MKSREVEGSRYRMVGGLPKNRRELESQNGGMLVPKQVGFEKLTPAWP